MATLEQIVYNIAENVNKEHDQVFLERLRFMVPYYRSAFLRRDDAKGRKIDQHFLQTLNNVEMTEVRNSITDIANMEDPALRSLYKIPQVVRLTSGPAIKLVTTVDGKKVFHPIEFEAVRTMRDNKWIGHEPRYYYRQGYIWLINTHTEAVVVEAVAEDPIAFELFNDPTIDILTVEYPVPLDFVQAITEILLKNELRGIVQDPTADDVTVNE